MNVTDNILVTYAHFIFNHRKFRSHIQRPHNNVDEVFNSFFFILVLDWWNEMDE